MSDQHSSYGKTGSYVQKFNLMNLKLSLLISCNKLYIHGITFEKEWYTTNPLWGSI